MNRNIVRTMVAIMIGVVFTTSICFGASVVTIKNYNTIPTLTQGQSYSIHGTIESNTKMSRVEIGVVNANNKWVTKYDKKFTSRLIELYIDTNDFTDEEKSRIIDSVLLSILSTNDTAYFGKICKYAEDNNIKPMFGTFGNVGNGDGLVGVAKLDNSSKLLAKLLDCGADPSKCNSISLPIAIKHGNYEDAMRLIDHGADIHANNDLAFKTLLKNDEKRFCKKGEEMFHNLLAKRLQEKQ